jgi:hypothetical protein
MGRLPNSFGGAFARAVRGAVPRGGGTRPQSALNELTDPTAQQLKVLQEIYSLMTGPGINVIVKNLDVPARFG